MCTCIYNHACVCAHLCDGKLAIAPDNTSSCVCIHMYMCSLLHVLQLKGGGGRFVCSVYMYLYDMCEWSSYRAPFSYIFASACTP